jgi:predicted molibdopterin-dependent oxidoreductase YjgC
MSICPYCGVGCGVEVGVADNRVVAVRGMKDHTVNSLTHRAFDEFAHQPEYKACAVRVTKA